MSTLIAPFLGGQVQQSDVVRMARVGADLESGGA